MSNIVTLRSVKGYELIQSGVDPLLTMIVL